MTIVPSEEPLFKLALEANPERKVRVPREPRAPREPRPPKEQKAPREPKEKT